MENSNTSNDNVAVNISFGIGPIAEEERAAFQILLEELEAYDDDRLTQLIRIQEIAHLAQNHLQHALAWCSSPLPASFLIELSNQCVSTICLDGAYEWFRYADRIDEEMLSTIVDTAVDSAEAVFDLGEKIIEYRRKHQF